MEKATRLFLVRHAETEWNTGGIFQGHTDSALTPRGLQQAAALAARLSDEGIQAVYSSDQGRAMQTARIVATPLKLPVVPRPELKEINTGDWTHRSYQDVRALWPEDYANWRSRPHLHQMPNGESVAAVQQRALRFVQELPGQHTGQSVCAVTHHTIVRAVVCHLLGLPLEKMWEAPRQPNCAVNLIEFRDGKVDLLEIANVEHLASIGTSSSTSV